MTVETEKRSEDVVKKSDVVFIKQSPQKIQNRRNSDLGEE
jgi:hypothetical protein